MKSSTVTASLMVCFAALTTAMPHRFSEKDGFAASNLAIREDAATDYCKNAVAIKLPTGNKRMIELDECKPMPPHNCIRDALTSLAIYREVCRGINLLDVQCWLRAPSIGRCCGEWVKDDEESSKWRDAPLYHKPETWFYVLDGETSKPIKVFNGPEMRDGTLKTAKHLVIKPGWEDFNSDSRPCRTWRPANDETYHTMMQHLSDYELTDANPKGQVVQEVLGNMSVIGYMP